MTTVAIVANGPWELLPDLSLFTGKIDKWIGADRGAHHLLLNGITPDIAVGDFDSLTKVERQLVKRQVRVFEQYPSEKDLTDLELALEKAYTLNPETIYLFGVTGGRLDHFLINIQTLYTIMEKEILAFIVDASNQLHMEKPGSHTITNDDTYPYVSFVPFTKEVQDLSLEGFYYPLTNETISWGSTRCISNKLLLKNGTFSFRAGILLVIKSHDAINDVH
ncbi:thiamine diphosphokinase [Lentibacillus sp. L22]|uniref:thiamine diphosphokinase n=1 Tax=Lentibacillus TaxID=175304 RepID=UPI0022B0CF07|nr:thiamine diphosphokinase [Lentibacillus daqui]